MSSRRQEVWGSPISHSLSPLLHRAAYSALDLDWEYRAVEVSDAQLADAFRSVDPVVGGLSLTMPLKQAILPLVSDHRGPVDLLQAANTLVREGNSWWLDNTDWFGAREVFNRGGGVDSQTVWILGAGATARSVIYALSGLNPASVVTVARSEERARVSSVLADTLAVPHLVAPFDQLDSVANPDWVVSTIPGGPFASASQVLARSQGARLFDIAYRPWPSVLAQGWLGRGAHENLGLWMLCFQALAQVRAFVGGDSAVALDDEARVREAMLHAVSLTESMGQ